MGLKDFFNKWNEKKKEEREEFRRMERELRFKKLLEEKQKTPMQKEHEFYQKEKKREQLKKLVNFERKQRDEKMKRLSNPFSRNNNSLIERNDIMGNNLRIFK